MCLRLRMTMKINSGPDAQGASDKPLPKDAQVIVSMLKDMGVMEYEPRVVNQLLEFSYRYITSVLDDAKLLSAHAKKKTVDLDDVKLAVTMYSEANLTQPPTRDILLETARHKNSLPLPVPKPTSGLRLPPDRFCLTACNYKLKSTKKKTGKHNSAGGGGKFQLGNFLSSNTQGPQETCGIQPDLSKIQIQTGANGAPIFSFTVNPPQLQAKTGLKRKAEDEA